MKKWIGNADIKQKILVLTIITIVIYGIGTAYVWTTQNTSTDNFDTSIYQSRTQTILDGELLYKDVHTETPPLINYILVPAQLLGGAEHAWVYAAYAAFFALLLSILMYTTFRRYDERKAFMIGLLTLLCPFMIDKSITGDDDSIVSFIFMIGVVSMMFERTRTSATMIAAGIWTKMWPVLLLPIHFLKQESWKKRMEIIAIVSLITILATIPFLVLCYDQFVDFLSYYFLGKVDRTTEGLSMFNLLEQGGLVAPKEIELGIVIVPLLFAYLYSFYKRWSAWKSATFIMIVFIIVYPKMHMGYYIMPMLLLMVWAVDDWKILIRLFSAFVPLVLASSFEPGMQGWLNNGSNYSWFIGFLLVLLGTVLFVDSMRLAFKRDTFTDLGMAREYSPSDEKDRLKNK